MAPNSGTAILGRHIPGHITMMTGNRVYHGLHLSDLLEIEKLSEQVTVANSKASSEVGTKGSVEFKESMFPPESTEQLAGFAEWFTDLGSEIRGALLAPLKTAARNLVRHRGYKLHQVPGGKCARIAMQMRAFME